MNKAGKKLGVAETIFLVWVGMALVALIPATIFLQGSFPIFTVVWLIAPLLAVVRSKNAHRVGFQGISWRMFAGAAFINLAALLLISLLVEPWSHTYQALARGAISGTPPDTTFAWLVRFEGLKAWSGLLLYSGLVTIFAEELFFRGWVLQTLQARLNIAWAIALQAVLFTIPQMLAAFIMAPVQGVIYAVVYSLLGIGIIGGWAAAHTQSIWPSLAAATLWNLIMIAFVI